MPSGVKCTSVSWQNLQHENINSTTFSRPLASYFQTACNWSVKLPTMKNIPLVLQLQFPVLNLPTFDHLRLPPLSLKTVITGNALIQLLVKNMHMDVINKWSYLTDICRFERQVFFNSCHFNFRRRISSTHPLHKLAGHALHKMKLTVAQVAKGL